MKPPPGPKCPKCGAVLLGAVPTLAPGYVMGKCPTHGTQTVKEPPPDQREARDVAIDRVERPGWQEHALRAIRDLATKGEPFTSDDVWHVLDDWNVPRPTEPRAMGSAVMYAVNHHWVVKTGRYVTSDDPASRNHARPQAEYRGR